MAATITAGVDIGSTASKALVLVDDRIASYTIGPSTANPTKTAYEVFRQAVGQAGIKEGDVQYIVGTGYGRAKVSFANENVSEISCHGKGAHWLLPSVRTVIDIGGQDTKTISLDEDGILVDFAMNDKCAAGTGRFLELMARSMGIRVEEMSDLHFEDGSPAMISNMCSVFAESEVINLINEEVPLPSIVKGLHLAIANRVGTLARRVGVRNEVAITGGVAKNRGVVECLEKNLNVRLKLFPTDVDPQIIGALGAAFIAREKLNKMKIK
jgi:predicted CoA-substrate-specific enzyme activase